MAFVIMLGLRASDWPLATTGSVGRKVPSVALRLNWARPSWKSIAGEQVPKSLDETEAVVFEAAGA